MRTSILAVTLLSCLTGACASADHQEPVHPMHKLGESSAITGAITYRERIALLPGSVAKVQLLDISLADAASTTIDEKTYDLDGRNVPIAFTLTMPNKGIPDTAMLSVRGEIRSADGKLLWTTDTVNPVMPRPVDQDLGMLVMKKVG